MIPEYLATPGRVVRVVRGDLKGSVGVIANVYRGEKAVSLRIECKACTDPVLRKRPAPDGLIHWIAHYAEIEPLDTKLITHS